MNRAYLFQSRGHKRRGKYIKTISVMGVLFMNKVYTLHDAVAKFVESGDCICFGGFTTNPRKPYAAVGEIRARVRRTSPSGPVLPAAIGT